MARHVNMIHPAVTDFKSRNDRLLVKATPTNSSELAGSSIDYDTTFSMAARPIDNAANGDREPIRSESASFAHFSQESNTLIVCQCA
jgi:hypothetical protein